MNEEILKLKKEIERLKKSVKKQRYGLVWMDVPEAFEDDVENRLPILKEVPDLAIKNDDGKPAHILIEGDNYHALTCLNYTHKGKIDVIYIDPPYNTGSDGFKYKDKRIIDKFPDGTEVPKEHPFRHSYWLSFMRKRLELARDLLKDDGVIFISIDDNEQSQLKLLCDEIFTDKNFVGKITIQSNPRGSQASTHLAQVHEYVLVYSKSTKELQIGGFEKTNIEKEYPHIYRDGRRYRLLGLRQRGGEWRREQRPNMFFPLYINPKTGRVSLKKEANFNVEVLPKRPSGEEGRWTWNKKNTEENLSLLVGKKINRKNQSDAYDIFRIDFYQDEEGDESLTKPKTIWIDKELNYQNGRSELKQILGGKDIFEYPKPTFLIKKLLRILANKDGIVLDFFVGSGTTAQAVMALNEEDKGKRQFIIVTNNENNIMTEVCYPRIKKLMQGYEFEGNEKEILLDIQLKPAHIEDNIEINRKIEEVYENNSKKFDRLVKRIENDSFRIIGEKKIKGAMKGLGNSIHYYKTAFIGKNNILNASDSDKVELAHNAGELLAIAENTLDFFKQNKYYQLFEDADQKKYTAVYFREELDKFEEFIEMVEKLKKKTAVYVFSWGNEGFNDEFEHIKDVRVKTIPQPILEIYKNIYNLGA